MERFERAPVNHRNTNAIIITDGYDQSQPRLSRRSDMTGKIIDETQDGTLAWIGVVLMGFSALATLVLLGWFISILLS
jgi:hypothetical protein